MPSLYVYPHFVALILLNVPLLSLSSSCQCICSTAPSSGSMLNQGRISDGRTEERGERPFQVHMLWNRTKVCAGSIYNADTVITAAHCVDFNRATNPNWEAEYNQLIVLTAGAHEVRKHEESQQKRRAVRTIIHPAYKGTLDPYDKVNGEFDIAIVKLDSGFTYTEVIQPIDILPPVPQVNLVGKIGLFSGWGMNSTLGVGKKKFPNILQITTLEILDHATECNEMMYNLTKQDFFINEFKGERLLCVQSASRGKDQTCAGDSGGPLTIEYPAPDGESKKVMAGLLSAGMGCGRGRPSMFTKLNDPDIYDWVVKIGGVADKPTIKY